MMSQSQKEYSQQTHPPVKRHAWKEQQHVSSAAAVLDNVSLLVCEGTGANLQNNWRAAQTSKGMEIFYAWRASKHTCTYTLLLTNTSLGRAGG